MGLFIKRILVAGLQKLEGLSRDTIMTQHGEKRIYPRMTDGDRGYISHRFATMAKPRRCSKAEESQRYWIALLNPRDVSVIGTLGVLRNAAHANLRVLPEALSKLRQTNFYVAPELVRSLLDEDAMRPRWLP